MLPQSQEVVDKRLKIKKIENVNILNLRDRMIDYECAMRKIDIRYKMETDKEKKKELKQSTVVFKEGFQACESKIDELNEKVRQLRFGSS